MDALGRQDVAAGQLHEWRQRRSTGANPVGQGRNVELDAFAGKALALAVERQVKTVLAEQDHRQQSGAGAATGNRLKRRRRLGAGGGCRDDDAFARQMRRQRAAHRLAPGEASDRALARIGRRIIGGSGACFQFLELQLQLVEQPAPLLRRRPEPFALQLGDQQLQMRDHRFGARCPRLGFDARRALGEKRRFQRRDVVGTGLGYAAHPSDGITKSAV